MWRMDRRASGEVGRTGTQLSQLSVTGGWHWQPDDILAERTVWAKVQRRSMCSTWEIVWVKQGCLGVVVTAMISARLTRPDHGRPLGFGLCGWLRRV